MKGTNSQNITVTIDGETVSIRKGKTVLEAAQKAGIYIPTLCYLEKLTPYGGCRLCIVDVKDMQGYPTACTTLVTNNMELKTKSPGLQNLRKEILELVLSEHPYSCLICKDKNDCTDFMHTTRKVSTITGCNFCTSNGDCELQDLVDYLDMKDVKYPITYRGIPVEKNNPFYDLDYNLCIFCGRCIRICNEERNSNVLAFVQRGNATIVGTAFNESQAEAGCEFCGACVDVCPTGSISEKMGKWAGKPDRSTSTTCMLCSVGCRINVNSRGNRVVNVGARPGERTNPPQICIRGKFLLPDLNHHPERILTPMIRKGNKWIEAGWDQAIELTAARLRKNLGRGFGSIGSGQDTLEDNYLLQKFTRKVMKSNNIDLFESYMDRKLVAEMLHLGLLNGWPGIDEILKADTILTVGTDASVSHPLVENRLRKAAQAGKTIICASPSPTRTSDFANLEIGYKKNESYNFLLSLAEGLSGNIAGEEKMKDIIAAIERSKDLIILAGDDLLRVDSARMDVRALYNIRYLKNKKGRCRILFLGYEGNQAAAFGMGAHPDFLPGFGHLSDSAALEKWSKAWDTGLRKTRGLSYHEMFKDINRLTALMVVGDAPVQKGLRKLDFIIQLNMFRTPFSDYADIILPITSFLENEGHFPALDGNSLKMNKVVRESQYARSISSIIAQLAEAMNEAGFSKGAVSQVWKEIRDLDIIPGGQLISGTEKPIPLKSMPGRNEENSRSRPLKKHNQYRYRGNDLAKLIPELKETI